MKSNAAIQAEIAKYKELERLLGKCAPADRQALIEGMQKLKPNLAHDLFVVSQFIPPPKTQQQRRPVLQHRFDRPARRVDIKREQLPLL